MPNRNMLFALMLSASAWIAPSDARTAARETNAGMGRANPAAWPAAASPAAITDTSTEAAIDAVLARMTIEQKVGQLIQADIGSITPADLSRYPLGSILAGGNSGPNGDERASAETWLGLVKAFRDASRRSGAGIPILFGVDAVHGHSNLPGATIFPHNIGLGAARDADLVRRIGAATAAEVAGSGIDWTFAPTLAVPQDMRWGRSYQGYSSDPAIVADYARAMTIGLQGELRPGAPLGALEIAATAKHFIADGGTADGRDQGDARIDEAELIRIHAPGYPVAIDAGALTVMASFSSWNGVKHHGNQSLLTDVLKRRMGFEGLVVGDWNGHGQIPRCSATDCPAAIAAGLDLFMAPDGWRGLFESTLRAARRGDIPAARLDDAVRRILRVKYKLGLIGSSTVERGDVRQVGAPAHLALAREAVAKSLVLLKNNGGLLPIRPGATVMVAGRGADDMAMQAGGWTVSWQGTDTKAADFPNGQTIGRAIVSAVAQAGGRAVLSPDGETADRPDVAILVVGEHPYAEYQGDIAHLAYRPDPQDAALIEKLRARKIPIVIVFLSGRPLFTGGLLNQADAFVAAWLPGSQGQGVADVLVAGRDGRPLRDFTGRLAFPWPADARSPISTPLFPLGYGLDYRVATPVGPVNEDPRLDLAALDANTVFFRRGRVPAPWFLASDGIVTTRAVDLSAQEDARRFTWTGPGRISLEGPLTDLGEQARKGGALVLDWRVDQPGRGPVLLALGGGSLDLGPLVRGGAAGTVIETRIPLACFADAGAELAQVTAPFRLTAEAGFAATIRTIRIETGGQDGSCPPRAR